MDTLSTGHLFAGIDGLGLGLEPHGFRTAWFSEYEDAPSRVLAHHYPDVPNHGDITAIDWSKVEPVDVLTGGFPCQDLSYAGKGAGIKEGTRSGLWFEYVRAIRALRPRIVIVENVAALLRRGLDIVLGDLAACGFDASWSVLRASDVGAAHRRERLFIVAVADADQQGLEGGQSAGGHLVPARRGQGAANPYDFGQQRGGGAWGRGNGSSDGSRTVADGSFDGRAEGWPGSSERPGRSGLAPGNREVAPNSSGHGLVRRTEPHVGTNQPGQQAPRRGDPVGRVLDWGEFSPAIRRWERTTGRPAPAPTIDGRLSAQFVEWHMGFPGGWVDVLSRNQALKALGNAVVPQCADVIGRWALELTAQQDAA